MKKILLIEDDSALQNYLVLRLSSAQVRVLATSTEKAGFQLAKSEQPDLVICGVNLPKLNGLNVLKAIRTDPILKDLAFLLLTNRQDRALYDRAESLRATGYIEKNQLWKQLTQTVSACLA
jgi:CheY-like chemotaxis protein